MLTQVGRVESIRPAAVTRTGTRELAFALEKLLPIPRSCALGIGYITELGALGGHAEDDRCSCFGCPDTRFAAEAMHLSEEVRLLKAKLQAAEDKAHAKLAQVRTARFRILVPRDVRFVRVQHVHQKCLRRVSPPPWASAVASTDVVSHTREDGNVSPGRTWSITAPQQSQMPVRYLGPASTTVD